MTGDKIRRLDSTRANWRIPDDDLSRQAVSAIRGYVYQLHQTAAAWINLTGRDRLYLEVAEDFAAIVTAPHTLDEVLEATQVKDTRESGAVTLNSPDVLRAIESLYRLQLRNRGRTVRVTFLTTSRIGKERKNPLPSGRPGLEAWRAAAQGGDTAELQAALAMRLQPGAARDFIRTASARSFRRRILSALSFVCGAGSWQALERSNRSQLVALADEVEATPEMAHRAYDAVLHHVIATVSSTRSRMLDRRQLLSCLRRATSFAVPSKLLLKYMRDLPVGEALRRVRERSFVAPVLPLDLETTSATDGLLRFSPYNERVPFVGRSSELRRLRQFIALESAFSWWVVTGSGGIGKTRLARQLCLDLRSRGWRAGFMPNGLVLGFSILVDWRPCEPTLIVVDYALERAAQIRGLMSRLARTWRSGPPVRMILLEREADVSFEQEVLGNDLSDRGLILESRFAPRSLRLRRLSETQTWMLVAECPWRTDAKRVLVSAARFTARLRALDAERRPLIAMILADALAEASPSGWSARLETHLRELIFRDRQCFWPAQLNARGKAIGAIEADVAIAVATLGNGLGRRELAAIAQARGRPLDPSILPACARAIGKPFSRQRRRLERLEPDLLGEFFVLETLAFDASNPLAERTHAWLPALLWKLHGSSVLDFVKRAQQTFPRHRSLKLLLRPVPGVSDSWWAYALIALGERNVYDVALKLVGPSLEDAGAAIALARQVCLLSFVIRTRPEIAAQLHLMRFVERSLIRAHRHGAALPRLWAASALEFIERLGARHPRTSLCLLRQLTTLLRTRKDASLADHLIRGINRLETAFPALPASVHLQLMRDALQLGLPLQTDPDEIAVWSVFLQKTEERLQELARLDRA